MYISPEQFCYLCLTESSGQLLRYPVEEVEDGLWLCARHKQAYLMDHGLELPAQHGLTTAEASRKPGGFGAIGVRRRRVVATATFPS